jgi:tetratricopeptide (TPR) repeat protein
MAEVNLENIEAVEKVKSFWEKSGKMITYGGLALILLLSGWIGYQKLIKEPKEMKAGETIFLAEGLFGKMSTTGFNKDSVNIVLNGGTLDGATITGMLKVISNYDGTKTANRARYITGACYLQIGEFDKAIKYLKEFEGNGADQIQSKAFVMLGHAYAEKNQTEEALNNYKKAAEVNVKDESITPDALMLYAAYAESNGKKSEAVDSYKKIKDNFPNYISSSNGDVDKRLARLGEFN